MLFLIAKKGIHWFLQKIYLINSSPFSQLSLTKLPDTINERKNQCCALKLSLRADSGKGRITRVYHPQHHLAFLQVIVSKVPMLYLVIKHKPQMGTTQQLHINVYKIGSTEIFRMLIHIEKNLYIEKKKLIEISKRLGKSIQQVLLKSNWTGEVHIRFMLEGSSKGSNSILFIQCMFLLTKNSINNRAMYNYFHVNPGCTMRSCNHYEKR